MPPLNLTVGNHNTFRDQWTSKPDGALGDNSDSTFGFVSTNSTNAYDQSWDLDDMPGDFASMVDLSVVLRYCWSATPTNTTWDSLQCRVLVPSGPILAAADATGSMETVASSITDTSPVNSSSIPFTYVNTSATKADWNSGLVDIRINRTRSKSGGSEEQRVFEADLSGNYTASAPDDQWTPQSDPELIGYVV